MDLAFEDAELVAEGENTSISSAASVFWRRTRRSSRKRTME